jgi:hypothetical protein
LRIAPRLRFDQRPQVVEQARIRLAQRLAAAAWPAYPLRIRHLARAQLGQSTSDRAARDARGAHDRGDPAMPGRRCLGRRKPPPTPLVEHRSERLEALVYGRFVNHAKTI